MFGQTCCSLYAVSARQNLSWAAYQTRYSAAIFAAQLANSLRGLHFNAFGANFQCLFYHGVVKRSSQF